MKVVRSKQALFEFLVRRINENSKKSKYPQALISYVEYILEWGNDDSLEFSSSEVSVSLAWGAVKLLQEYSTSKNPISFADDVVSFAALLFLEAANDDCDSNSPIKLAIENAKLSNLIKCKIGKKYLSTKEFEAKFGFKVRVGFLIPPKPKSKPKPRPPLVCDL